MLNSYAIVGDSHEFLSEGECPAGHIQMQGQRPGNYNLAQADGTWGPEGFPVITCTKRQGELALLTLESPDTLFPSLLHWVETAIEAVEDPIEKRMMLAYFNAYEWHSNDEFVTRMWTKAGRDLEDLPGVFLFAQTL